MQIFTSDVKVYYNEDCQKYGVMKLTKGITLHRADGITRQLYKWSQVLIHDGKVVAPFQVDGRKAKCYTPYKKVAERWADSIRDHGVIEVRADMEEDF